MYMASLAEVRKRISELTPVIISAVQARTAYKRNDSMYSETDCRIEAEYRKWVVTLCREGDEPETYHEAAKCDEIAIRAVKERLGYSEIIAAEKLRTSPALVGLVTQV
jgi:chorismate mutase